MKLTEQRGAVAIDLDRRRLLFFSMASTWLVIERYGLDFAQTLYSVVRTGAQSGNQTELRLKSMDALCFMLWAGLQDELQGAGEELKLETVAGFITPFNVRVIFNKLVVALTRTVSTPEHMEKHGGKVEAASSTAKPAAGKTAAKVSRLKVRSGLRQVRSAGR